MSRSIPRYATVEDWISHDAIPFSIDSSGSFAAALEKLVAALGDQVDLLGIGEALHGGEEILVLRNRLFQVLAETYDYSAIAVESSFPRATVINDYVNRSGPASYEAVRDSGFSHGFGQLEANRALVEWMRQVNADSSHHVKLHFYGFDSPTEMTSTDSPRQLLYVALDYLAEFDAALSQAYRDRIEPLLGQDAAWENPAAMFDPALAVGLSPDAAALRLETEELITELRVHRPDLVALSGRDRYLEAERHAVLAQQLLVYHAALARPSDDRVMKLLGMRDAMMADNLAYIAAREQGRGKVLVFAHNNHLQRGVSRWELAGTLNEWWPAGAHLDALFGARYAVIGSAVGVSDENGIGQPEAGTLEALLTAAPGPLRFVPTYKGDALPPGMVEALPVRSSSTRNSTYFVLTSQSVTDFDWIVALDSTGYTKGGPRLPE